MSSTRISEKDLTEALADKQNKKIDEKQRWVNRILKSAKQYHKLCPYYDKRTKMCFIAIGVKCDREGKFDTCYTFRSFLEKKYDEFKAKNKPLPLDFTDVVLTI
ncbi:MAG: hypothetical protein QW721_00035 [Desulfurococcaceae archaeon]|jgi:hypothetical protein